MEICMESSGEECYGDRMGLSHHSYSHRLKENVLFSKFTRKSCNVISVTRETQEKDTRPLTYSSP